MRKLPSSAHTLECVHKYKTLIIMLLLILVLTLFYLSSCLLDIAIEARDVLGTAVASKLSALVPTSR